MPLMSASTSVPASDGPWASWTTAAAFSIVASVVTLASGKRVAALRRAKHGYHSDLAAARGLWSLRTTRVSGVSPWSSPMASRRAPAQNRECAVALALEAECNPLRYLVE